MQPEKHDALRPLEHEAVQALHRAARRHGVAVEHVVLEALRRGERPAAARTALDDLDEATKAKLAKLAWPWDCATCGAAVTKVTSCTGGHMRCAACAPSTCALCKRETQATGRMVTRAMRAQQAAEARRVRLAKGTVDGR